MAVSQGNHRRVDEKSALPWLRHVICPYGVSGTDCREAAALSPYCVISLPVVYDPVSHILARIFRSPTTDGSSGVYKVTLLLSGASRR